MGLTPAFIRRRIAHRPNLLRIVDNIAWLLVDKLLRMGTGLLVVVWIARYLGSEQFGLLSFATAFVSLFGFVSGLGLQGIVVRDIVRDPSSKEETLGTAAALKLIGGLIAYSCVLLAIFWLRPNDQLAKTLVAILGSAMLFNSSEITVYWFESQVLSRYTVWAQNSCFLIFAAVKVGLIVNNAPLVAFAWATLAEAVIVALVLLSIFNWYGLKIWALRITMARAKTLLSDSWPLLLSGIAIIIYMKVDQIMLGQIVGDKAVGVYSVAVRISEVWYFIPTVITSSIFPSILKAKERSESDYNQLFQNLYDLMVAISFAIALPMTFLSAPLVAILFGEDFFASGPVLVIHIWSSIFVSLSVSSGKWLLSENRQDLAFQRNFLGLVVNIALNFILIPSFGAVGAAIATIISYALAGFAWDYLHEDTRLMFYMKLRSLNIVSLVRRLNWQVY